jgi:hypothetical protein
VSRTRRYHDGSDYDTTNDIAKHQNIGGDDDAGHDCTDYPNDNLDDNITAIFRFKARCPRPGFAAG